MSATRLLPILLLAALLPAPLAAQAGGGPMEIAVTFDDLPSGTALELPRLQAMTRALVAAIRESGAPAVGFVNEGKLYVPGEVDERAATLAQWLEAGLELANHSFSHFSLHDTPLADYQADIVRGETVTRMLLARHGGTLRWFRHPFLRTARSLEDKAAMRAFLERRGYTVAPVTIDNTDWMFATGYATARSRDDRETMRRIADAYLAYTEAQFEFSEDVTQRVFGRRIPHVLLLHANELNADHYADLVALMRRRGYRFIPLEQALRDEAYAIPDTYTGPAGVGWLFRWAREKQVRIDWRAEPTPPAFIRELFERSRTTP